MNAESVTIFLLSISVMLLFAKVFGEIFLKLKQPAIVGEIIAGVILGPTVFGMISPESFNWLFPASGEVKTAFNGLTTIAVVLLLLVSGLEVDLSVVMKQGKKAASTGVMGILLPFTLGFGAAYLFPKLMGIQDTNQQFAFALFMGTALSISALPVIAKTLMDLKIFKTEIGFIIISAAMFNDIVGWLIFSIILGLIGGSSHNFTFYETLIYLLLFSVIFLLAGRKLIDRLIPVIQNKTAFPGGIINFILILGFLGAAFTEYIGIHAIFGAFIAGIAIGDSVHLKEKSREIIHQFITNIFAPLFFVAIGLSVNFVANFDPVVVLIILLLSFIGKVVGCGLGALWSGSDKYEALIIGFGMNSRGTMEIILGLLALSLGLIQETVFVALVIMALITSIASAPMMNYFLKRREEITLNNLISADNVLFIPESDKGGVIKLLAETAAGQLKIPYKEVLSRVEGRELQDSTGIVNYLAIPHAKLNIAKPLVIVAKLDRGINFDAFDSLDSRVIILLLTPEKNNELQLRLLAEAAKKFEDRGSVEELLEIKDKKAFAEKLKSL